MSKNRLASEPTFDRPADDAEDSFTSACAAFKISPFIYSKVYQCVMHKVDQYLVGSRRRSCSRSVCAGIVFLGQIVIFCGNQFRNSLAL